MFMRSRPNRFLSVLRYPGLCAKGGSKSSSSTSTSSAVTTRTSTDTSTGNALVGSAGQGAAARVSAVDSNVDVSIEQHGLSGAELGTLLAPAASAIESISRDFSATKSSSAAVASTVGGLAASARDVVSKVVQVAGDAAVPIALAVVGVSMLRKKASK